MKLLDLFCGAGGAGKGYHDAGFDDITGVDHEPQPRYPFAFIQADAMEYLAAHGHEYDVIHASPPCQRWVTFTRAPWLPQQSERPDLLTPTLAALRGFPVWVCENVPTSPIPHVLTLCGSSFDLRVRRHRRFASSHLIPSLECRHREQGPPIGVYGNSGPKNPGGRGRRYKNRDEAARALGIDWMTIAELRESIPPAYTEWIGRHLILAVKRLRQEVLPLGPLV